MTYSPQLKAHGSRLKAYNPQPQMNITHINATDLSGGAARAAYRLHCSLGELGLRSHMLVHYKSSADPSISLALKTRSPIEKLIYRWHKAQHEREMARYPNKHGGLFSAQMLPSLFDLAAIPPDTDVIHLHWVCGEFVNIKAVAQIAKLGKPMVWTLHDMWPLTGGCHYAEACNAYTQQCGSCPSLHGVDQQSPSKNDLSQRVFKHKQQHWQGLPVTFIAPSTWVGECAQNSALFRHAPVKVIHHGLDLAQFHPHPPHLARQTLGLPLDKKLILFGAMNSTADQRKGFHLLLPALQQLANGADCELVIFGSDQAPTAQLTHYKTHVLGAIHNDATLSQIYAAADVMVVPSLQETFGQTAAEALACGTPVVAFDATGLKDVVDHRVNGYLARPFDPADLAAGIAWVIAQAPSPLRTQARAKAERAFSQIQCAQHHVALYRAIVSNQ